ncbi:Polyadenylate-binding protein-interacting protein 9 [Striga hermonthica]|uniref:Polyadenylate-binding protein-interacting protein 9 n=1 Tax=Striga hermonthica TaxID=68872 RepID=A0A9N7R647_STRHE|nr:Polyadenylate-binding protein-interacting protein 9 [Striga hermonthica]
MNLSFSAILTANLSFSVLFLSALILGTLSRPRQRRNNYNQVKNRMGGRASRSQREDSIRRIVYVSDINHNITEEQLAALFSGYGLVVDCRVCGDPHSHLRFAFVEFADDYSARAALNLNGTLLGFSPVKVLPSSACEPVFSSQEDEREMCARIVYCTNIDKKRYMDSEIRAIMASTCHWTIKGRFPLTRLKGMFRHDYTL